MAFRRREYAMLARGCEKKRHSQKYPSLHTIYLYYYDSKLFSK